MTRRHANTETRLRLLLLLPFALLVAASLVLAIAALGAAGAAEDVRYPDSLPVFAGLLAAAPAAVFGLAASMIVWERTFRRFVLRRLRLFVGVVPILFAALLLLAYSVLVGDPDHYRGEFNPATGEWDPRVPTSGSYISLVLGVATVFPMGGLALAAKVLYLDAIEPAKLDRPDGPDPIGSLMNQRR